MRYSGDGQAVLSVFHQERVDYESATDPWAVISGANWRIWSVDLATRQAAPVDGIDWNSGATYMQRIDDTAYVLVPGADYATSQVYAVDGASATSLFETRATGSGCSASADRQSSRPRIARFTPPQVRLAPVASPARLPPRTMAA